MKFSANLGFLWSSLPLTAAIRQAGEVGFDAVECHWPYDIGTDAVLAALEAAKLPMLSLNTRPGNGEAGEFGLSAVPGRQTQAQDFIEEAVDYAALAGVENVHVMAGVASGNAARTAFAENLDFACRLGADKGVAILIEPINPNDISGYFLCDLEQAASIIDELDKPNLRLMFDCYHVARIHGDPLQQAKRYLSKIGHVQFASVPDRAEPDYGDVNYPELLSGIEALGYGGYFGAEYKPRNTTDAGLGWLQTYKGR